MSPAVETVLVVFGLIGVGWSVQRLGLVPDEAGEGVAGFVFSVALPALLFRTLATADFGGLSPWGAWGIYFPGVAVTWIVGTALVRRVFGRDRRAGLVGGISAAFANTLLIGIPLVSARFGEKGLAVALVIVSIHLPVMLFATLTLEQGIEHREQGAGAGFSAAFRQFARRMATNPIIIGILAGGLWRLLGLPFGGVPARIVGEIAGIAGPLALIASGMSFARLGLSGTLSPALALAVAKLILMPGAVLGLGLLLGVSPLVVAVATAIAACPTGVNAFLIASQLRTGQALATNTMMLSTAAGALSVSLWLVLVERLTGL